MGIKAPFGSDTVWNGTSSLTDMHMTKASRHRATSHNKLCLILELIKGVAFTSVLEVQVLKSITTEASGDLVLLSHPHPVPLPAQSCRCLHVSSATLSATFTASTKELSPVPGMRGSCLPAWSSLTIAGTPGHCSGPWHEMMGQGPP